MRGKSLEWKAETGQRFGMIVIRTEAHVGGLKAREITDFLLDPANQEYQRWWEGTPTAIGLESAVNKREVESWGFRSGRKRPPTTKWLR